MRKLTSWKYGSEISLRDFLQVQICKLKTKGILREFLRKWRKHPWNLDSNGRTTQEWFECDPIRPWCDHDVEYISIEISSKHWPWRSESEAILRNLLQLLLKYCRTATVLLLLLLVRLLPVLALPLLPLLLLLLLLGPKPSWLSAFLHKLHIKHLAWQWQARPKNWYCHQCCCWYCCC